MTLSRIMVGEISFIYTGTYLENTIVLLANRFKKRRYERTFDFDISISFNFSSDFDGFLRLQRIHKNIPKNVFPDGGPFQFRIDAVRQVTSK